MTLRANVTTTYRETNAAQPYTVSRQKEPPEQGSRESDTTRTPARPANKVPDQGVVPAAERGANRSATRNRDRIAKATDSYEPRSAKAASSPTEGSAPPGSASGQRSDADDGKAVSRPAGAAYGPGLGRSAAEISGKSAASPKPTSRSAEYVRDQSADNDEIASSPLSNSSRKDESLSQSLPLAAPPKIRLTGQADKTAAISQDAASDEGIADGWNEEAMQNELMAALQFGQPREEDGQSHTFAGGELAKHLQAEGVFGISAAGRNLGATDFIRQKQFEYRMDQRQFGGDDLLLEAEKAIQSTLNSDQSSAVSKSLLQAAESINAYRNESLRTSEYAETGTKPTQPSDQAGKTPLKKPG